LWDRVDNTDAFVTRASDRRDRGEKKSSAGSPGTHGITFRIIAPAIVVSSTARATIATFPVARARKRPLNESTVAMLVSFERQRNVLPAMPLHPRNGVAVTRSVSTMCAVADAGITLRPTAAHGSPM
jgi:hypothetical protein